MIKFFTSKTSPDRLLVIDENQQKAIEFQSESNKIFPLTNWGKVDTVPIFAASIPHRLQGIRVLAEAFGL